MFLESKAQVSATDCIQTSLDVNVLKNIFSSLITNHQSNSTAAQCHSFVKLTKTAALDKSWHSFLSPCRCPAGHPKNTPGVSWLEFPYEIPQSWVIYITQGSKSLIFCCKPFNSFSSTTNLLQWANHLSS